MSPEDYKLQPYTTTDNFLSVLYGCLALLSWITIFIFLPFHIAQLINERQKYKKYFWRVRIEKDVKTITLNYSAVITYLILFIIWLVIVNKYVYRFL